MGTRLDTPVVLRTEPAEVSFTLYPDGKRFIIVDFRKVLLNSLPEGFILDGELQVGVVQFKPASATLWTDTIANETGGGSTMTLVVGIE